jgi:hypothetical protein
LGVVDDAGEGRFGRLQLSEHAGRVPRVHGRRVQHARPRERARHDIQLAHREQRRDAVDDQERRARLERADRRRERPERHAVELPAPHDPHADVVQGQSSGHACTRDLQHFAAARVAATRQPPGSEPHAPREPVDARQHERRPVAGRRAAGQLHGTRRPRS